MKSFLQYGAVLVLAAINLTVAAELSITPEVEKQSVSIGKSFVATCAGEGKKVQRVMWNGPDNQQIIDYRSSMPQNDEEKRIHVEKGSKGQSSIDLVFDDIKRKDRGKYTCSANVDGQELQKTLELIVIKSIDFSNTQKHQFLYEGMKSNLTCDPNADPPADITWNYNNRIIQDNDKYEIDGNNLYVHNVTTEDAGTYTCTARQLTEENSDFGRYEIMVDVHHKPEWPQSNLSGKVYGYVEGQVNLTCEANAQPAATFTWIKDGEVKEPSDYVQIFTEYNKSILQLTVHDQSIFGDYECKVKNELGNLERVIVLEEGVAPPVPVVSGLGTETNAILLSLNEQEDETTMPVQGYRVQYKLAGGEIFKEVNFHKGSAYTINGLDPDTVYVFRAAARNAAGLSGYSEGTVLRTEKSPKAGEITSSAAKEFLSAFLLAIYIPITMTHIL